MTRKDLYISCTVGLLLVAFVAVMLLGNTGNETSAAGETTVGITDTTTVPVQNSVTQGQSSAEQTQPVVGTEAAPTVSVPSVSTLPTPDQNTEEAETTQSPNTENSGISSKPTQTMPTFDVEFGVGGGWIFDEETEASDEQKPTVPVPPSTKQPTPEQNTEETETIQSSDSESTETAPSVDVEFGVGGDWISDEETETPSEQKPTVSVPPVSTLPTPDQNTEEAETTQPPETENSGMPGKLLTYEEFLALTSAEQQAYFFLFKDPLDYANWMQKAQKEYEDGQTSIIVTGPVDLSTLPTGGNEK